MIDEKKGKLDPDVDVAFITSFPVQCLKSLLHPAKQSNLIGKLDRSRWKSAVKREKLCFDDQFIMDGFKSWNQLIDVISLTCHNSPKGAEIIELRW
jgi:hypothetical protein